MYNQEFQRLDKDDLSTSPCPKTMQSIIIIRYIHSCWESDLADKTEVYTPGSPTTSLNGAIRLGRI